MAKTIFETAILSVSDTNLPFGEIKDADWRADLGLVAILEEKEQFEIFLGSDKIFKTSVPVLLEYPLIRWVDNNQILLVNPRNETNQDNVFLLSLDGRLLGSFNAGDGIMDIEITQEGIWISYFDEGIFGEGISTEGLVLFNSDGRPLFGYHHSLSDKPFLVDCNAMCNGEESTVWIFPIIDPDEKPALMQVDAKTNWVKSFPTPKLLSERDAPEVTALSVRGQEAYFHSQFDPEGNLYYWELGTKQVQLVGQVEGILKGLKASEEYHFIAVDGKTVKLLRISHD